MASSRVKDKNCVFTECQNSIFITGKIVVFYRYLCNEQHIFIERWIKIYFISGCNNCFFNKIIDLNLSISKEFMSFFLCNHGNSTFLFVIMPC